MRDPHLSPLRPLVRTRLIRTPDKANKFVRSASVRLNEVSLCLYFTYCTYYTHRRRTSASFSHWCITGNSKGHNDAGAAHPLKKWYGERFEQSKSKCRYKFDTVLYITRITVIQVHRHLISSRTVIDYGHIISSHFRQKMLLKF